MSNELVVVAMFSSEGEAEIARTRLESEGIPAAVMSDDAGGVMPFLQQTIGVRLLVNQKDAETAKSLLDQAYGDDASE